MLYSVISAIEEAAPPVGSRPGLGSSVMASTIESLRAWASTPAGRLARAAREAEWVRTLRRVIMVLDSNEAEEPSSPTLRARGKRGCRGSRGRLRLGHGGQQGAGVGMPGRGEQALGRALFDDAALPQHGDLLAQVVNDGEVVADQHVGDAEL